MTFRTLDLCTAITAVALAITSAAEADPGAVAVLHCGHLLDAEAGVLLGPTTIVIAGKRIRELVPGTTSVPGASEVELGQATCLPGLIDLHTHLTMEMSPTHFSDLVRFNPADYALRSTLYARRTLLAGFTTVRNLGDAVNQDSVALRNAINAGLIVGPRIYTAGRAIGSTGGHADATDSLRSDMAGDPGVADGIINSVEDAAKAVRLHYKAGADLIKIMPSGGVLDEGASGDNPQLTLDEIKAVVSTAHDYGFSVAAHAHGAESIRRAILGGADSIEHGTFLNDEDLRLMKEHGTWYVPTLTAGAQVAEKAQIPGYFSPQVAAKAAAIGPQMSATLSRAYRAGVKIAFGTDAGVYPHGQNAQEFGLMVQAGLPPMVALQAATVLAAQVLRHDKDLGSLTAGKLADVVAVNGNPLRDIGVMRQVSFVMKEGLIYKRDGHAIAADGE